MLAARGRYNIIIIGLKRLISSGTSCSSRGYQSCNNTLVGGHRVNVVMVFFSPLSPVNETQKVYLLARRYRTIIMTVASLLLLLLHDDDDDLAKYRYALL